MGNTGTFELLVMLAILRLGDDAYGVTIRQELEREISRTLTLGNPTIPPTGALTGYLGLSASCCASFFPLESGSSSSGT